MRAAIITAAAAALLAGCSSTTPGTTTVTRTVTRPAPPTPAAAAGRSYSTGTYVVDADIAPGTYRSDTYSGVCVFQRLANLTGDPAAVIGQAIGDDGRPLTEQILPSDKAVTIGGGCQFHRVR